MITNIIAIAGNEHRPTLFRFVTYTAISAALQALATLLLFPLGKLFGSTPIQAWPWVLTLIAVTALIWMMDLAASHAGLDLGLNTLHVVDKHGPRAVKNVPSTVLTPTRIGELRTLLTAGGVECVSAYILLFAPLLGAIVFTVTLAMGLVIVSPPLAAVALFGGVLMLIALWLSTVLERRSERNFSDANMELDNRMFEFAWAQPSLRTSGRTADGESVARSAVSDTRHAAQRILVSQIGGEVLFSITLQIVFFGFGLVTYFTWVAGTLTSVEAAAAIIILLRVVEQITAVSTLSTPFASATRILGQIRELIETPTTPTGRANTAAPLVQTSNLNVTHPDGTVALAHASVELEPGTVTVVVGSSGAGKTTLLYTLAGLIEPNDGEVYLDGQSATTGDLRAAATVIFQDTVLNPGTLADNLRAVNPELTNTDLDRIATISQLSSIIESAPNGWETTVGELGGQLSGGERQRVGIARALVKPSHLLLIDEATSNLDSLNERAIVDTIDQVHGDYTTLIITHRPAILRIAHRVLVMDNGRIVADGSPEELRESNELFATMMEQWERAAQWQV